MPWGASQVNPRTEKEHRVIYYMEGVKPGTHGEIISYDMSYEIDLLKYLA